MSATINENAVEAVTNQQEQQFSSRIAPSEPLTQKGHQPGRLTSAADLAPEFSAQTLPAGTAPRENIFQPQLTEDVQPNIDDTTDTSDANVTTASASDTLAGATSADVSTGLGQPVGGQTATELRHDGAHGRAKQRHGLEGVGAGDRVPEMAGRGDARGESKLRRAEQRAEQVEDARVGAAGGVAAEERVPESAEAVAREVEGR